MDPKPTGFCPVFHTDVMPLEVCTSLETYTEQFPLVKVCQTCLCNSVAYSNVECDPDFCRMKLQSAVEWSRDPNAINMRRKFGGSCKAIAREYNKIDSLKANVIDQDLFDMVWDLRNE